MKQGLVVDDSRVIRKIAASLLAEFSFTALEADDTTSALHACGTVMPDLILVDWHIPGWHVPDMLRRLRQAPGGEKPYILYCTTENDVGRISEALHAGADDYLLKPYDRGALMERLAEAGLLPE